GCRDKHAEVASQWAVSFIDWLDGSRCMLQSTQQNDQMIQSEREHYEPNRAKLPPISSSPDIFLRWIPLKNGRPALTKANQVFLECTGKKSARKTDDYKSRRYEKGADEEHHHLTRRS